MRNYSCMYNMWYINFFFQNIIYQGIPPKLYRTVRSPSSIWSDFTFLRKTYFILSKLLSNTVSIEIQYLSSLSNLSSCSECKHRIRPCMKVVSSSLYVFHPSIWREGICLRLLSSSLLINHIFISYRTLLGFP